MTELERAEFFLGLSAVAGVFLFGFLVGFGLGYLL